MAEFLTIEIAVLNLKADATLEDVESTAGKTWADLVTTLKDYPVEGHRFFLGRQMQQESTAYLISSKCLLAGSPGRSIRGCSF